jgi:hypothetical protein
MSSRISFKNVYKSREEVAQRNSQGIISPMSRREIILEILPKKEVIVKRKV